MGCDIHTIVEIKKEDKWVKIKEIPEEFNTRNYSTFAFLANVRNSFNTNGFEAKGIPEDISDKTIFDSEDYHSHSYLTLQELIDKDKTDYCSVKCKILKVFYDKFIELGGVLPEGINIEEEKPNGIIDAIRYSFEPTVLAKWQTKKEIAEEYPIFKGIKALKEIAQKYKIENFANIRIVFAFDN